jgi:hypothetical protein
VSKLVNFPRQSSLADLELRVGSEKQDGLDKPVRFKADPANWSSFSRSLAGNNSIEYLTSTRPISPVSWMVW